ncbi:hypothetical protein, partial [Klebsiella aerogenes]|uniref:hypothetical protein n=1 Tax=Klebsiella aerogenes TaxID=548 RepID=UPI00195324B3
RTQSSIALAMGSVPPLRLALSALGWLLLRPRRASRGIRLAARCGTQGGRLRHLVFLVFALE